MKHKTHIFVTSLILTVGVFLIGIFLSYGLDYLRINAINDVLTEYELGRDAFVLENTFTEALGEDTCPIIQSRIGKLKQEIGDVGAELERYSSKNVFRQDDFEHLQRKYVLLQLRFLTEIKDANDFCNASYIKIVHFYDRSEEFTSQRQAYILSEISKEFESDVVAIALDTTYDKEPIIDLLIQKYNITEVPSVVIEDTIYEGVLYTGEVRQIVRDMLANNTASNTTE